MKKYFPDYRKVFLLHSDILEVIFIPPNTFECKESTSLQFTNKNTNPNIQKGRQLDLKSCRPFI